jgi:hypothetical protein
MKIYKLSQLPKAKFFDIFGGPVPFIQYTLPEGTYLLIIDHPLDKGPKKIPDGATAILTPYGKKIKNYQVFYCDFVIIIGFVNF